jgi:hypothetical protein
VSLNQDICPKCLTINEGSLFQIDLTAIVAAFFPEVETLMATLFRGGRKKTNDIILSWIKEVLDKRRSLAAKGIQG